MAEVMRHLSRIGDGTPPQGTRSSSSSRAVVVVVEVVVVVVVGAPPPLPTMLVDIFTTRALGGEGRGGFGGG